jgi:hypothetical protein
MNKEKSILEMILRFCCVILGIAFIVTGIFLFLNPLDGGLLEKISIFTFFFFGVVFLIYGLTGHS